MQAVNTQHSVDTIKVIDTDSHLSEPHDLWTKRAPIGMKDRVPQVRMLDGKNSWVIDGDKSIGTGANPSSTIRKDGSKIFGRQYENYTIDQVHAGSYDAKARVGILDQAGIWAQIVYPNILGFGGQRSAKVDPALRLLCVQIYNDAMAEFQQESSQRLFPMALLPWWDIDLAVAEGERVAQLGFRGININSDPHVHKDITGKTLPDLGHRYWDPLWDLCSDKDLPVNFHIGASEQSIDWYGDQGWPSLPKDERHGAGGSMLFFNNGRIMASIIYSGVLDRYPKLKFVSVESGVGWIPFFLESLDYQFGQMVRDETLELKPSEYFKRNFYACFWFERKRIANTVKAIGADNLMFETDFPHPTCLYPVGKETYQLPNLTAAEQRKVLSTNASKVYNIVV
jgi:predicted TIM-barrel fold metal-dependent hydrolase